MMSLYVPTDILKYIILPFLPKQEIVIVLFVFYTYYKDLFPLRDTLTIKEISKNIKWFDVCKPGYLVVLKNLFCHKDIPNYKNKSSYYNNRSFCNKIINRAAIQGNLEVVKWLCNTHKGVYSMDVIINVATNGHLEVLKWIITKKDHKYNSKCTLVPDKLSIYKKKYAYKDYTKCYFYEAFVQASNNGHLEVVKWMYYNIEEISTEFQNINLSNILKKIIFGYFIPQVMQRSKLNVIEWLFSKHGSFTMTGVILNHNKYPEVMEWAKYKRREYYYKYIILILGIIILLLSIESLIR